MPVPACCARLGQAVCVSPRQTMTKPTIKQVWKDGIQQWEVTHAGMTRFFKNDWQANWHYESCIRLHRSRFKAKASDK